MTAESKRKIQLVLAAAIAVAAVRAGYVLYNRYSAKTSPTSRQSPPLNPDYYVVPKKLHAYDLKSAHELTRQPVWVKEGYRFTYYPFDRGRQRTDFSHEAGVLGPIEQLQITNVLTDVSLGSPRQRQVVARFEKQGRSYALPIGSVNSLLAYCGLRL